MLPSHLYTALIDVLAYRQYLDEDRQSGNLGFQDRLSASLRVLDSVNEAVFRIQGISDTILITCADHNHFLEFLAMLREVFVAFLEQKLFVRGAVAYSRHFQNKVLTYSHAVARAYELESQIAGYPRIVIDQNIVQMYDSGESLPRIRSSGLLCLENGVHFLDILTSQNWQKAYDCAKAIYDQSKTVLAENESAFTKHLRFQKYLLESPHAPASALPYIGCIQIV